MRGNAKGPGGYVWVFAPEHPGATIHGYVYEHILIAEKTLGRLLGAGNVVHHVNGVRDDNRPENLVICENNSYHLTLHRRQRAVEAGAPPDWWPCLYCGRYEPPLKTENVRLTKANTLYHLSCSRLDRMARYAWRLSGSLKTRPREAPLPYPPHWKRCSLCKNYDDPSSNTDLVTYKSGNTHHRACANRHQALKRIGL